MENPARYNLEDRLRGLINERPLITIRLDIINKCNLRCIMCHYSDESIRHRPVKYFTSDEFRKLFIEISPHVGDVMLSCADEPLTSKYFAEILSIVADYPPLRKISLCTNATLMTPKVSALFIEKGVTSVMLSMDGVTKKTVERIRVGSNYERVIGNIMTLRDIKRISGSKYPVMIMSYVMMNSNIHEAPVFIAVAKQLGIDTIDFRHAAPTDYWNDPREVFGNYKGKYNYYHNKIIEASQQHQINVILPPPFACDERWIPGKDIPLVDLSDFMQVKAVPIEDNIPAPKTFPPEFGIENSHEIIYKEFPNIFCHRPFTDIQIRDFEEILPCPWLKTTLGKINDGKSLFEIFSGEAYQHLRKNMFLPNGDPNCDGCMEKSQFFSKGQAAVETKSTIIKKIRRLFLKTNVS